MSRVSRAASEVHLFLLWSHARETEAAILADVTTRFRLLEAVEVEWSREHFARSLTRLYGTALPPGSDKEQHGGTGPFLVLVVEVAAPRYRRRRTGAGRILVETTMFDARTRYRGWTGGGYRVHASLDRVEAERDLFLVLGRRAASFGEREGSGAPWPPDILRADPVGTQAWRSVDELLTALAVTTECTVAPAAPGADLAVTVDDLWWAEQIIGGRPVGESAREVDVNGSPYTVALRAAPRAEPPAARGWAAWRRRRAT